MALEMSQPVAREGSAGASSDTARDLHELLTVDEVAALLKVSKKWVYEHTRSRRMRRSERLPHLKLGKYLRFDPRDVQAFLVTRR